LPAKHYLKALLAIPVLLAAAAVAGCEPAAAPTVSRGQSVRPPVNVYQLARQLNLRVESANDSRALLRGAGGNVLIYPDPQGQVYVNGRRLAGGSGIYSSDGVIYVSRDVEPLIRTQLGSGSVVHTVVQQPPRPYVRPYQPEPAALSGRVVLDAGHGGHDPGTTGGLVPEKEINLNVALAAARLLRARGVDVVLSRDDDTFIELEDRAKIANRCKADLFVSLHANWSPRSSVSGYMAYVAEGASSDSVQVARAMGRQLAGKGVGRHGPEIQTARFKVLMQTQCPAVLLEMGFVSNRAEARKLADSDHQQQLAAAVADAVVEYLQGK
jgi:N-acetylmuramoyl-L-alanine amidase